MHVVLLGARAEPLHALLARNHKVTVVYEGREADRAGVLEREDVRLCRVGSFSSVDSLQSTLDRIGVADVGAVVTCREFALVPAALLGAGLGVRSLAPDVALNCRDKAVQKSAWRRAGIATPNWVVLPEPMPDPETLARQITDGGIKGPFVVKPIDCAGTRGVSLTSDTKEIPDIVRSMRSNDSALGRFMVEQYNGGDEWHFDGVVRQGRLEVILVSRYLNPVLATRADRPVATAGFRPDLHPDLYAEAGRITTRALAALGLEDGVFHFEVFGQPGDFETGELAARPGGSWIPSMVEKTLGVNLYAAAVDAVTGDGVEKGTPPDRVFGFTHLPSLAGRRNRLDRDDLAAIPGVVDVEMAVPVGEVMPEMRSNAITGLGRVLVTADDHDACRALLEEVASTAICVNSPDGNGNP